MFSYQPFSDEELNELKGMLPEGIYKFFVDKVEFDKAKSSGNPMLVVHLWIDDAKGNRHTLKDYIVSQPNMAWKLKHFCEAVGLGKEYELKKITEHSFKRGMKGEVIIFIQEGKENGKGGYYPDKNQVKDYIVKQDLSFATIQPMDIKDSPVTSDSFQDSDIPF